MPADSPSPRPSPRKRARGRFGAFLQARRTLRQTLTRGDPSKRKIDWRRIRCYLRPPRGEQAIGGGTVERRLDGDPLRRCRRYSRSWGARTRKNPRCSQGPRREMIRSADRPAPRTHLQTTATHADRVRLGRRCQCAAPSSCSRGWRIAAPNLPESERIRFRIGN